MPPPLKPRFLLLQVIDPHYHQDIALANMHELEQLVATFGGDVAQKSIQHRVNPHPATYVGAGKVEWLVREVREKQIDIVVINAVVKAGQLFRLEKTLWSINPTIKVWDRVDLILGIFQHHARTTESKLQIELAQIQHQGPRIYGLGKTALSRQGGGIGTRGKGETNIEFERRLIKDRTRYLQKQLDRLANQKQRRIQFRKEQGLGPVALVGYTSAGKTTLFNSLTGKSKQSHQSLFTTLDTVVGKLKVSTSNVPILISDTIGFIEDLPPALVAAFKSTLLESLEAQLLLHVIDATDSRVERKIKVVNQILDELEISQPVLLVFNKVDQLSEEQRLQLVSQYQEHRAVCISAHTGQGLPELKHMLSDFFQISPS